MRVATVSRNLHGEEAFLLSDFPRYYRRFLGLDEGRFASGEDVFASEQRTVPLCHGTIVPLLATVHRGRVIFSVSPEYEADFRRWLGDRRPERLSDELLGDLDDFFLERLPLHIVSRMLRMTVTPGTLARPEGLERAETMTEDHREAFFRRMGVRGKLFKLSVWRRSLPAIREGRRFVVTEGPRIVSDAHVSDIDWGGGNLAVATMEAWRRRGFGSAVVVRAAEWCLDRGIVPIYWVDAGNEPSVRLAGKLGFETRAEEIAIRIRR